MVKLRVSCWVDQLPKNVSKYFAVITAKQASNKDQGSSVLGQTEVVLKLSSEDAIDFCRTFVLEYNTANVLTSFGGCRDNNVESPGVDTVIVSLYERKDSGSNKLLGTALFDVETTVASRGHSRAQELGDIDGNNNGTLAVRIEPVTRLGTLSLQLRGIGLTNTDGMFGKSDPYYVIQRLRSSGSSSSAWDTVYKSDMIKDDLNPTWDVVTLDLDLLSDASNNEHIRFIVYDTDSKDDDDLIGMVSVTIQKLIDSAVDDIDATITASPDSIDTSKALELKNSDEKDAGKIVVVMAVVEGIDDNASSLISTSRAVAVKDENDVPVIASTFMNYVSGGCDLNVIVGIDSTASNGNPHESGTLHHFTETLNSYETAIYKLCQALAKYDSDQQYPVYGFGAKIDDAVSHCFSLAEDSDNDTADGVSGILQAYRNAFRAGLVMASPRDFAPLIRKAIETAKQNRQAKQCYTILLLFTNGSPECVDTTMNVLKEEAINVPLSIVIVGIGGKDNDDNFQGIDELMKINDTGRDLLRFVRYRKEGDEDEQLTMEALHDIPSQLETYFVQRGVYPQPESVVEEIVVQPYIPSTAVTVPLGFNDAGKATVSNNTPTPDASNTDDKKPDTSADTTSSSSSKINFNDIMQKGKAVHGKLKKNKMAMKMQRKYMSVAKKKVNKLVGMKIL